MINESWQSVGHGQWTPGWTTVRNFNLKILADKLQTVYDKISFTTSFIRILLIFHPHHTTILHAHVYPNEFRLLIIRFLSNTYHTNPVEIPSIERHWWLLQTYFGDVMATITWECHVVTLPWARVGASTSTAANNANIGIRILSEKRKIEVC